MSERIKIACELVRDRTGFEPGAEVSTSDLLTILGIEEYPARIDGESHRAYARRARRHSMSFIAVVKDLRLMLLHEHNVDLQATHRGAYRIVPPGEQGPRAARDGAKAARAALRDALDRIKHTDAARLTPEQRIDRDAAMLSTAHRLSMLHGRTPSKVLEETRRESAGRDEVRERSGQPAMRE